MGGTNKLKTKQPILLSIFVQRQFENQIYYSFDVHLFDIHIFYVSFFFLRDCNKFFRHFICFDMGFYGVMAAIKCFTFCYVDFNERNCFKYSFRSSASTFSTFHIYFWINTRPRIRILNFSSHYAGWLIRFVFIFRN